MSTRLGLVVSIALSGFGCVDEGAAPVGEAVAPIVNGTVVTEGDGAVVALTTSGLQFCSGTLVRPRVVVTAAHCLPPNVEIPVDAIEIFFGNDVSQAGTFIPAVDAVAHPAWNIDDLPNDVGVLAISEDAPVAPIQMRTLAMGGGDIGAPMRIVGYGLTFDGGDDNGVKRTGDAVLEELDDFNLLLTAQPGDTCSGDSGGPTLMELGGVELLAGIHSRSDCIEFSLEERVDVHVDDFIQPFIALHEGGCAADGVCNESCAPGEDPDCGPVCEADGVCVAECAEGADPDCEPPAPVCEADGVCVAECAEGADPDCDPPAPVCEDDGACVEECAEGEDPDCDQAVDEGGGGCAAGGDATGGAWFAGLFALLLWRRRSRVSVR
jgi:MYXO-CTERM domain-containing protein